MLIDIIIPAVLCIACIMLAIFLFLTSNKCKNTVFNLGRVHRAIGINKKKAINNMIDDEGEPIFELGSSEYLFLASVLDASKNPFECEKTLSKIRAKYMGIREKQKSIGKLSWRLAIVFTISAFVLFMYVITTFSMYYSD